MGHYSNRLILIILLLLIVGVISRWYSLDSLSKPEPETGLVDHLSNIPGWNQVGTIKLENEIASALDLDDYVNYNYENASDEISLYIGQYFSTGKVGSAHDPMVCFPGQGWKVSERFHGKIPVPEESKTYSISYSAMTAESGDQKLLIIYWFQSVDSAHSSTVVQKLSSFWKALSGQGQTNAFIRITTPLRNRTLPEARNICFRFINDFYPLYLSYISQHTGRET